jgi:hypothetical protein
MTTNLTSTTPKNESQQAIDEWLAKGNVIQQIPYGKRSEESIKPSGFYGRKKKTVQEPTDEV